ncbi:MAG: STAS domain-containing protein [Pseudomonadota bacterium]
MGIFSNVIGKIRQKKSSSSDDSSRPDFDDDGEGLGADSDPGRVNSTQRQNGINTEKKIRAIQDEMEAEMLKAPPAPRASESAPPRKNGSPGAVPPLAENDAIPTAFQSTMPLMEMMSTEVLLDADDPFKVEVSSSEMASVIVDAAVLYANNQTASVEQMILDAIQEDKLGNAARSTWWMLFDLYRVMGKQIQFDNLSIDYASKFETSPPAWTEGLDLESLGLPSVKAAATPSVVLNGPLDANVAKHIERLQKISEKSKTIRLDMSGITQVDPVGCQLLFNALQMLRKSERELIYAGAAELAQKIRGIIEIGRRDENEAPWLLLLEIIQLLNQEQEFEEVSIDYCVTYEVSPPAFVAPKNSKVVAAAVVEKAPAAPTDHFMMPMVVQGSVEHLVNAIMAFAEVHTSLLLDCSRLIRVDFTAAGELLNGLTPLSRAGKSIQFHEVNHLVAALFHVMDFPSVATVVPHRY